MKLDLELTYTPEGYPVWRFSGQCPNCGMAMISMVQWAMGGKRPVIPMDDLVRCAEEAQADLQIHLAHECGASPIPGTPRPSPGRPITRTDRD